MRKSNPHNAFEAGLAWWRLSWQAAEVATASASVIQHRVGLMSAGELDRAGRAELARMVPEKVDAFSKAGVALWSEWATLGLGGAAGATDLATSGARVLAPIHRTATANARRIARRRRSRGR